MPLKWNTTTRAQLRGFRRRDANDPSEQSVAHASDRYGFLPSLCAVHPWGGPSTVARRTGVRCAVSA